MFIHLGVPCKPISKLIITQTGALLRCIMNIFCVFLMSFVIRMLHLKNKTNSSILTIYNNKLTLYVKIRLKCRFQFFFLSHIFCNVTIIWGVKTQTIDINWFSRWVLWFKTSKTSIIFHHTFVNLLPFERRAIFSNQVVLNILKH